MTKFIVHIGDGKCGSTSVQKGLYDVRASLRDMGIIYETVVPSNGHFNLVSLVGKGMRGSTETMARQAHETISDIRARLQPDSTVLLSAESFFNLPPDNLIEILRMISPEIDRLDLIAYVRAPHSMYLSLVQQTLKADSLFTMPDQYARQIDRMLQRWRDCSEVDSLTVHNFDRDHLIDGDVVPDFTQMLRDLTGRPEITLPSSAVNVTLSAEQLVILQQFRAHFLKDYDGKAHEDSQKVVSYFEALNALGFPGSKPALKDRALASLRRGNAATVASVNTMFPGLGLDIPDTRQAFDEVLTWDAEGSVNQILDRVDRDILKLVKQLVSGFNRRITRADIAALIDTLREVADARDLDADALVEATITFWRRMKYTQRADILADIHARGDAPPDGDADASSAPETGAAPHPMILYGKGGWLFLKADSNRVLDQIAGTYPLAPDFKQRWQELFEYRAEMARQIGYQYFYGIAPNKECVYPEYLPDGITVTQDRPVAQVLEAASCQVTHRYYLDALVTAKEAGEDMFVTGDTHWNHLGALVACNEAMRAMGLPEVDISEFVREEREIKADLSIKMGQLCPATVLTMRNPRFKLIEDNRVNNIGHRRIYEHEDKTLPSCVYFRDSFTSHQLEMFAARFSRIVYLWQPNIDYDIVKREAPDFVINQQVERFLVECPDDIHGPSHEEYETKKRAQE